MKLRPRASSTSLQAAALWCREYGGTVGMTSGSFDLLHDYHLRYLKRCARECDTLVVGIDSDRLVAKRKGPTRPILTEFQREMLLNAVKYVGMVYILDSLDDYRTVAEVLGVHKVFVNQDFLGRETDVAVGSSKAEVVVIPDLIEHNSTTALIRRITLAT